MSTLNLIINSDLSKNNLISGIAHAPNKSTAKEFLKNLSALLEDNPKVALQLSNGDAVSASGTITCSSVVATDAVTIGGITLTAVASGATNDQFNVGLSNAATAANLHLAFNASTDLDKSVLAMIVSGAVLTVSTVSPGAFGNYITLSSNSADLAVSGATLSGGASESAPYISFKKGY